MQFQSTITKEEINELELRQYEGTIELIEREEEIERVFRKINEHNCVGFDTETKPVFVKGQYNHTSLVQISIPDTTFLIRTNKVGLPDALCEFFANDTIKKLGVALMDDIKDLQKLRQFTGRGFLELNQIVKSGITVLAKV